MRSRPPRTGAPKGTRGRIVELLRRSGLTANELARHLGLTHNAVRSHLAVLLREGLVREVGTRSSGTRPAVVYEVVPEAETGFSTAYVPFVAQLVRVLRERLPSAELDDVMRTVGRRLASDWPTVRGPVAERVEGASALLEELGAPNDIEQRDGRFVIRNYSRCMLAQAVHGHPEICRAMESLIAEFADVRVRECCERSVTRPRCCFEIESGDDGAGGRRVRKVAG